MTQQFYICDECSQRHEGSPKVVLNGAFQSGKSGILLARYEFHFDKKDCLVKWLERAALNENL